MGGAGGNAPPPEFVRSVNPIQNRRADYATYTAASPLGFKKLSTPLCLNYSCLLERFLYVRQDPGSY